MLRCRTGRRLRGRCVRRVLKKLRRGRRKRLSRQRTIRREILGMVRRRRGIIKGAFHDMVQGKINKKMGGKAGLLFKCVVSGSPRAFGKLLIMASPIMGMAGCLTGVDPRRLMDNPGKVVKQAMKNVVSKMTWGRAKKMGLCVGQQILNRFVPPVVQAVFKKVFKTKIAKKVIKGVVRGAKKVAGFFGSIFSRRRRSSRRRRRFFKSIFGSRRRRRRRGWR